MKWSKNTYLKVIAMMAVCVMLGAGVGAATQSNANAEDKVVVTSPFTEAISQVRDSVVGVRNYQSVRYSYFGYGFGNREQAEEVQASSGSGVVIADHYVLTNYHVVEGASSLKISVYREDSEDPTLYDAQVAGYDESVDVAVLYVPALDIAPVKLGDSDSLQVGDWAICIGNALSFSKSVTVGVVSALDRGYKSYTYDRYGRREAVVNSMIQTDAAINKGISGGDMFSVTGELVGIPTLKYSGQFYSGAVAEGIGMCIPINAAKPIIEEALKAKVETTAESKDEAGKDSRSEADQESRNGLKGKPRLGVTVKSLNPGSSLILSGILPNGVYVDSTDDNGPAAAAGIKAGDIIVDLDDTVITTVTQLQEIVAQHKEGDTLKVKVFRIENMAEAKDVSELKEGEYLDFTVTLAIVDSVAQ